MSAIPLPDKDEGFKKRIEYDPKAHDDSSNELNYDQLTQDTGFGGQQRNLYNR